jgi:hypothetical protein
MFKPDCRKLSPVDKKFPRVQTLQTWARQHFACWLKTARLGGSGPDSCDAALPVNEDKSDLDASVKTVPLKGRWTEECLFEFFNYKDNNGGNQGNHCL